MLPRPWYPSTSLERGLLLAASLSKPNKHSTSITMAQPFTVETSLRTPPTGKISLVPHQEADVDTNLISDQPAGEVATPQSFAPADSSGSLSRSANNNEEGGLTVILTGPWWMKTRVLFEANNRAAISHIVLQAVDFRSRFPSFYTEISVALRCPEYLVQLTEREDYGPAWIDEDKVRSELVVKMLLVLKGLDSLNMDIDGFLRETNAPDWQRKALGNRAKVLEQWIRPQVMKTPKALGKPSVEDDSKQL
ncbi:hypothetical protein M8818_003101 [Zalaria obscura]|uniref:Uncharacterized protein n=1 Tax=Zalaria obscura TaxID=2024903 RepID=A0ACC3SGJ4_9PEZI